MSLKTRGQIVHPADTAQLKAIFKDSTGTLIDLDTFPSVSIVLPSGLVSLSPTTAGVIRNGVGSYEFDYAIGINPSIGVYNDVWTGTLNGFAVQATFSFIVSTTDLPKINSDGYSSLGDDVGFNYSQIAIDNIDRLVKGLKARLNSSGKSKKIINGNVVYIDCDIYTVDVLVTFLGMAISDFNQTPYFTNFTWEDTAILTQFMDIIIKGATLYSLASKALIERGREFNIADNGLTFTPPTVSEMLNTQYTALISNYYDQLKYIKNSMRPAPKGLGTLTITAMNPAVNRLRHLRSRRFF